MRGARFPSEPPNSPEKCEEDAWAQNLWGLSVGYVSIGSSDHDDGKAKNCVACGLRDEESDYASEF